MLTLGGPLGGGGQIDTCKTIINQMFQTIPQSDSNSRAPTPPPPPPPQNAQFTLGALGGAKRYTNVGIDTTNVYKACATVHYIHEASVQFRKDRVPLGART